MSEFHTTSLGAVLSLTTGRLLTDLDEMYALQDFLVGHPLMTHERAYPEHWDKEPLLAQFPALAEAEPPKWEWRDGDDREAIVRAWVHSVGEHVGWHHCHVVTPEVHQMWSTR